MAEIRLNLMQRHDTLDLPGKLNAFLGGCEIEKGVVVPDLVLSGPHDTIRLWPVPCNLKELAAQLLAIDRELEERQRAREEKHQRAAQP